MVLFRSSDGPTPLTPSLEAAGKALAQSVDTVTVTTANPGESVLVDRFNIRTAPLPMVVVLAPNGAITGSFKTPFTPDQARATLKSRATRDCMLAIQQRKLVFVCIQGASTTGNAEAMEGVTRFREDPALGKMAEAVLIDPADPAEQELLNQMGFRERPAVAQTLLLAPPGKILGKWSGATSRDLFTQLLAEAARARQTCQVPGCQDPACPTPPPGEAAPAGGGAK
jgi:hypothetical protein